MYCSDGIINTKYICFPLSIRVFIIHNDVVYIIEKELSNACWNYICISLDEFFVKKDTTKHPTCTRC